MKTFIMQCASNIIIFCLFFSPVRILENSKCQQLINHVLYTSIFCSVYHDCGKNTTGNKSGKGADLGWERSCFLIVGYKEIIY